VLSRGIQKHQNFQLKTKPLFPTQSHKFTITKPKKKYFHYVIMIGVYIIRDYSWLQTK